MTWSNVYRLINQTIYPSPKEMKLDNKRSGCAYFPLSLFYFVCFLSDFFSPEFIG